MSTTIRTLPAEDAVAFLQAMAVPFLRPPAADGERARAAFWLEHIRPDLDRTWAGYDGDRIVGTLRTLPFELTVPGGAVLSADGVTAVTVSPTHRRQGVLTGMMAAGLRAAADRGDPVSVLLASEWPIYGRFGFGPATERATWTVDRAAAAMPPAAGVAMVPVAELRELAPAAYDRARLQRPGGLSRPPYRWEVDFGLVEADGVPAEWTGYAAVHRDPTGAVDGYLRWHAEEHWANWRFSSILHVDELVAASDAAYRELWRFALGVDLIATVRAPDRRTDEPLPHLLTNGRAATQVERSDFLWVRLLDVPAALAGRAYTVPGRTVLEVVDRAGYAAGRFALDAGPDGAECAATPADPDLTLPVTALGAAYLGGARLRGLAEAGLVDEHRPGALAAADRLLAGDLVPWCALHF